MSRCIVGNGIKYVITEKTMTVSENKPGSYAVVKPGTMIPLAEEKQ